MSNNKNLSPDKILTEFTEEQKNRNISVDRVNKDERGIKIITPFHKPDNDLIAIFVYRNDDEEIVVNDKGDIFNWLRLCGVNFENIDKPVEKISAISSITDNNAEIKNKEIYKTTDFNGLGKAMLDVAWVARSISHLRNYLWEKTNCE